MQESGVHFVHPSFFSDKGFPIAISTHVPLLVLIWDKILLKSGGGSVQEALFQSSYFKSIIFI